MPVKVYIWSKAKSDMVIGHASMSLSDGTHISWWPTDEGKLKNFSAPARQGQTLNDDINLEESNPTEYTIPMTTVQEKQIKAWWENFKATTEDYHLLKMNCSTVVYNALCVAYPFLNELAFMPVWIPAAIEWIAKQLQTGTPEINEAQEQDFKATYVAGAVSYITTVQKHLPL